MAQLNSSLTHLKSSQKKEEICSRCQKYIEQRKKIHTTLLFSIWRSVTGA